MNAIDGRERAIWALSVLVALLGITEPVASQDHSQHRQPAGKPEPQEPVSSATEREAKREKDPVDHAAMGHGAQTEADAHAPDLPREAIPALSDADRAAAFSETGGGHAAHDDAIRSFVQLDQLEVWDDDDRSGFSWEARGWIGGDIARAWLRTEGERVDSDTEAADVEVLFGRAISPWWDLVGGVRHDFKPGGSQTFAGIGVIGLAPYKFELEASAYLGESGQTTARIEAEYELLLTNRLILQPLVEVSLYGEDDARRGIGAGLSTLEAGLRLRYEFTRRFAPYVGVVHERAVSQTADFRRAEGRATRDTIVVAGVRTWF